MAKGDPHKIHKGYRRNMTKTSTLILRSQFQAERFAEFQDMLEEEEFLAFESDFYDFDDPRSDYSPYDGPYDCVGESGFDDFGLFDHDPFGFLHDPFGFLNDEDDNFDNFGMFREPTILVEDEWRATDCYDAGDEGIGHLRYLMEDVKPADVFSQDIAWVVQKYTLLSAIVLGGLLSREFFVNDDEASVLGRYFVNMEARLREAQIEFKTFHGLTEKGWDYFRTYHCNDNGNRIGIGL